MSGGTKREGRTLYVSDLDGTLLRSDQRTSDYTNRVINELTDRGMLFSYATARSYVSSHRVTAGLTARIPVILYNGAMTRDSVTGERSFCLSGFGRMRMYCLEEPIPELHSLVQDFRLS